MLRIATNTMGLNTHRNLKAVSTSAEKSAEKLSSGLKINRAADDAAGLAITEKMRNQVTGLNRAQRNVQDGISLIQTADAGMNEIGEMLKRQRELTIQAMNDTNAPEDKKKIQMEIDQLTKEITSTAEKTEFNTIPLLTGGAKTDTFVFTVPRGGTVFSPVDSLALFGGETVTVAIQDLTVSGGQNTTFATFQKQSNPGSLAGGGFSINMIYPETINDGSYCETWDCNGASYSVAYPGFVDSLGAGGDGSATVNNVISDSYWFMHIYNRESGDSSQPAETSYGITVTYHDRGTGGALYIKSGANEDQGMYINTYDCRAASIGADPIIIDPLAEAEKSLQKLDAAIETVNSYRANAGAQQNRLEHTSKNLGVSSENLDGAKSRISDTDMAKEMMEYTKGSILQQAGISMLAQANQSPQRVLELMR